jgi:hypothetical protein
MCPRKKRAAAHGKVVITLVQAAEADLDQPGCDGMPDEERRR